MPYDPEAKEDVNFSFVAIDGLSYGLNLKPSYLNCLKSEEKMIEMYRRINKSLENPEESATLVHNTLTGIIKKIKENGTRELEIRKIINLEEAKKGLSISSKRINLVGNAPIGITYTFSIGSLKGTEYSIIKEGARKSLDIIKIGIESLIKDLEEIGKEMKKPKKQESKVIPISKHPRFKRK